tara:strand:+ start:1760 stop:2422 length:663 start_codon:yes stop_codon:yes gene_type:complete
MPEKQAKLKAFKKDHGAKIVDKVTIDQLVGGARSIKCMLWETSLLDANEGIRFRGYTIPELQQVLPSFSGNPSDEPTPEGLLWLLLTGEVPTKAQCDALTAELHQRAKLPSHVEPMIRAFPKGMHPMTQFSSAMCAAPRALHHPLASPRAHSPAPAAPAIFSLALPSTEQPGAADRLRLRARVRQGHQQVDVLGPFVRGHDEPGRAAAGGGGADLPLHVL